MKTKTLVIGIFLLGLLLIIGGKMFSGDTFTFYNNTHIACLSNGHENVALHVHPILTIFVDGEKEILPANIGITNTCMAEIHTHDETGTLHVEALASRSTIARTLSLLDFFVVWDQSLERSGYIHQIMQDGEIKEAPEKVLLTDHSEIIISYISATTTETLGESTF